MRMQSAPGTAGRLNRNRYGCWRLLAMLGKCDQMSMVSPKQVRCTSADTRCFLQDLSLLELKPHSAGCTKSRHRGLFVPPSSWFVSSCCPFLCWLSAASREFPSRYWGMLPLAWLPKGRGPGMFDRVWPGFRIGCPFCPEQMDSNPEPSLSKRLFHTVLILTDQVTCGCAAMSHLALKPQRAFDGSNTL